MRMPKVDSRILRSKDSVGLRSASSGLSLACTLLAAWAALLSATFWLAADSALAARPRSLMSTWSCGAVSRGFCCQKVTRCCVLWVCSR